MKKTKLLPAALFAALIAVIAACVSLFAGCTFGYGGTDSEETPPDPYYAFELERYEVTYDISKNCSIAVTEIMTVHYLGPLSTGFFRDIPVNANTQVKNVKAEKLKGDSPSFYYDVDLEFSNFVSVSIGDSSNKYKKTETYRLTYTYVIMNSVVNKGTLPLNPVGAGWECEIKSADVTLILPDGYTGAKCYYGKKGSTATLGFETGVEDGRTVLTVKNARLDSYNGITFDIEFDKGAIKSYFDFTPFIFVIIAAAALVALILIRVFLFNKSYVTPVVNYEAPRKMNPLMMGKLIDNKIDNEDITSMIFYWASKGYLKINMENKDNPTLIRIVRNLPESCENYERTLFEGLFRSGDAVQTGSLANKYYKSVDIAKAEVNAKTKGKLYKTWTSALALGIAVAAGLALGLTPLILAFARISHTLLYAMGFMAVVPAVIVNVAAQSIIIMRYKMKPKMFKLAWVIVAVTCVIVALVYLFVPSYIMGMWAKLLLGLVCMAIAVAAATLVSRTKEYDAQLGEILGFKEFIRLAEKEQLELMLEDNPQFYYDILPYAQVLGVSDIWEDKFSDITVLPPQWLTGDAFTDVFMLHSFNVMIRSSMRGMSSGMVSRPSSSGFNGGGGGFGGHSGGGFGGGGGRGR